MIQAMVRFALVCVITGAWALSAHAESKAIVSFTFDDVPKSVLNVGIPILDAADFQATIYVSTDNTRFPGYMNWEDIAIASKRGWEVAAHTHLHGDLTKMTNEEILEDLLTSTQQFAEHGYSPTNFASPFGSYDERVISIIRRHYASHRTAWPDGINREEIDPYRIMSFAVDRDTTLSEVTDVFEDLRNHGGWLVLQIHHLFPKGEVVTEPYGTDLLYDIVELVRSGDYAVLTVSAALKQVASGGE